MKLTKRLKEMVKRTIFYFRREELFFTALAIEAARYGFKVERGREVIYLSQNGLTFIVNFCPKYSPAEDDYLDIALEQKYDRDTDLAECLMDAQLVKQITNELNDDGIFEIENKQDVVTLARKLTKQIDAFGKKKGALIKSGNWNRDKQQILASTKNI